MSLGDAQEETGQGIKLPGIRHVAERGISCSLSLEPNERLSKTAREFYDVLKKRKRRERRQMIWGRVILSLVVGLLTYLLVQFGYGFPVWSGFVRGGK
jgi:predicted nucleic acid-binding Zn ribbon protein